MKKKPTSKLPEGTQPAKSLSQVLKESELVRGMVKESADELASVNLVLQEEFSSRNRLPELEMALEKSEAVEIKVQEASEKLSGVNQALEKEVKERHVIEQELAKVMDEQKQTLHAALHDALTGLPNRVLFNDRLEHGMEQAKRHGWTLAVMFMDLDKFKTINDSYGHDAGDAVLLTIAKRLKETTRTDDTVSRHGGDEFLYLLMEINGDQDAAIIAKKIIKAVQVPCDVSVGELTVSTSIGISIFPRDGTTVDALIKSADAAMYRAKQSKSGYSFASDDPTPPV
ncbi:MAG: GGDEF domain-containing protein [Rhodoferax sp.]|uniref:GGDEF domain-containing protein n=1 Tax=Rhodoferax sp. TaxID=50421 RepID=UPI001807ACC6|nr:GGDEF domain-containing protein [Rhodoferax sp.]NMM14556.1 GGDEF domain-containing protein [Rhodoferax sp.]NMM19023.1 GGDEF domain-containing protein [Rhodoferax sp.]